MHTWFFSVCVIGRIPLNIMRCSNFIILGASTLATGEGSVDRALHPDDVPRGPKSKVDKCFFANPAVKQADL